MRILMLDIRRSPLGSVDASRFKAVGNLAAVVQLGNEDNRVLVELAHAVDILADFDRQNGDPIEQLGNVRWLVEFGGVDVGKMRNESTRLLPKRAPLCFVQRGATLSATQNALLNACARFFLPQRAAAAVAHQMLQSADEKAAIDRKAERSLARHKLRVDVCGTHSQSLSSLSIWRLKSSH